MGDGRDYEHKEKEDFDEGEAKAKTADSEVAYEAQQE